MCDLREIIDVAVYKNMSMRGATSGDFVEFRFTIPLSQTLNNLLCLADLVNQELF